VTGKKGQMLFLGATFLFWMAVMSIIVYIHYVKKVDPELKYFTPDIIFDSGTRSYYSISIGDTKVGYKSEAITRTDRSLIYMEDIVIKLNIAGISREVFFQCAVSLDSTSVLSRFMDFTIHSGNHQNNCRGTVRSDSLIIEVRKDAFTPWQKGIFTVDENMTFPTALPYYLHRAESDSMSIAVFDPVIFDQYRVSAVRRGEESFALGDSTYRTTRYELSFLDKRSTVWLDDDGIPVKSEGAMFFAGLFGDVRIEKSMSSDVFLLPLEVSLGNDLVGSAVFTPDTPIPDPRNIDYMEIRIDGIRAANIDVTASNKEVKSFNPVVFAIHREPLPDNPYRHYEIRRAAIDTTVYGISDFIQAKDARFQRTAESIVTADSDTLTAARQLNRWVFQTMRKEEGLDITRSIDILRLKRGACDEHTKLFTALARSIGIPTLVNLGYVYRDGAFRYHSWPTVFVDGMWHDLDPLFGQDAADATHVAMVRGGFDTIIELLRIQGKMSISVLDAR